MLVTKTVKNITNISKLSPTQFVLNIRQQHRCSRLLTLEMFRFRPKLLISTKNNPKFVIQIVTFSWILSIVFAIAPSLVFVENFQTFFNFWICQFPFSRFDKLFSHYFITRNILGWSRPDFFIRTEGPWPLLQGRCLGDSRKGGSNFKGLKLLYTLAYF